MRLLLLLLLLINRKAVRNTCPYFHNLATFFEAADILLATCLTITSKNNVSPNSLIHSSYIIQPVLLLLLLFSHWYKLQTEPNTKLKVLVTKFSELKKIQKA